MILSYLEGQTLRELMLSNESMAISFEKLYTQLTKLIQDIHNLRSIKTKPLNRLQRPKTSNIIVHLPSEDIFFVIWVLRTMSIQIAQ